MSHALVLVVIFVLGIGGSFSLPLKPTESITSNGLQAPWFCHELDCPSFDVVEVVENDIELRQYQPGT